MPPHRRPRLSARTRSWTIDPFARNSTRLSNATSSSESVASSAPTQPSEEINDMITIMSNQATLRSYLDRRIHDPILREAMTYTVDNFMHLHDNIDMALTHLNRMLDDLSQLRMTLRDITQACDRTHSAWAIQLGQLPEPEPMPVPGPNLLDRISDNPLPTPDYRDYRTATIEELQLMDYSITEAIMMHALLMNAERPVTRDRLQEYKDLALEILEDDNRRVREELGPDYDECN